jgi:hypothetical protein
MRAAAGNGADPGDLAAALAGSLGDPVRAGEILLRLLRAFRRLGPGAQVTQGVIDSVASSLDMLLANPAFRPDDRVFPLLAGFLPEISTLYFLSKRGGTDHLLPNLFKGDAGAFELRRALLALSPFNALHVDIGRLAEAAPVETFAATAGLLSGRIWLDEAAEELRTSLLALGPRFSSLTPPDYLLDRLSNSWMFCSYAQAPDRHDFKHCLNGMIANWWRAAGIADADPQQRAVSRPRVLVMAEILQPGHAMHRCFAPALEALRRVAFTIGIGDDRSRVEEARDLFDEVTVISNRLSDLRQTVATIRALEPDMIYWPSCGMRGWSVMLANLRLAPVQFMSIGHPATTRSPHMDYVVGGTATVTGKDVFSEIQVQLHRLGNVGAPGSGLDAVVPEIRRDPAVVRVAINSKSVKITPGFLQACRRIAAGTERRVEFHVFPNESGLQLAAFQRKLAGILPGAVVYPATGYGDYMKRLAACDVRLGTFPFGGANTNIDCVLVGVPGIVLVGDEPHARTDMRYQKVTPQPGWTMADTVDGYVRAAIRLIDDDAERVSMSEALLASDPQRAFFEDEHRQYPDDFPDAVDWIWRHHAAIKASGRQFWRAADRSLLSGGTS